MDIRTKLVFALVAVALGSMAVLGFAMSRNADTALKKGRLDLLEAVAEAKKDGMEQVFLGWIDRVRLVASRSQLSTSLREYERTRDPRLADRITRILNDAVEAVDVIEALAVFDHEHRPVASAGREMDLAVRERMVQLQPVADGIDYRGVSPAGNGDLRVGFVAHLTLEDTHLGDLHVRLNAQPLLDLAEDRSGLEEDSSAEVVIVTRDESGTPRALHRLHPGGPETWEAIEPRGPDDPVSIALSERQEVLSEGITDDRGHAVWAATRGVPEAGLFLVVKVDEDEAREPLLAFQRESRRLTLSLGAFAILLGTILGFRFSQPIKNLAAVADQIREGNLGARAVEVGEDEVGLLARTFNEMAEGMEAQVTLLREFQTYFEVSLDMLCIAGSDAYFKRVNPAFERILGWTTEDLLSRPFLDFVHPEDLDRTIAEIDRLAQGLPTISFENRYRTRGGSYRNLQWTAHPDRSSGLIYAIARDVTDVHRVRGKAAAELRTLRQRVRDAEGKSKETA